jgi:hypothetical protein
MLMSPWAVQAAGLGKLTVNSALGQPFKAEIDLIAVEEEMPSLTARLVSRDAFVRQMSIMSRSFRRLRPVLRNVPMVNPTSELFPRNPLLRRFQAY